MPAPLALAIMLAVDLALVTGLVVWSATGLKTLAAVLAIVVAAKSRGNRKA